MNVRFAVMTVAAVLMAAQAGAEATETPAARSVVVRTYQHGDVPVDDLREARAYADRTFALAGVTLVWVDCNPRVRNAAVAAVVCEAPPAPGEIVLRIRPTHSGDVTRVATLGMSLVNTARGGTPPVFTTVYCDRTKSVARAAGVDERRVLGYAIAHELGHLLLDTPGHSASGLMRAWWSAAELRRNTSADWGFDATAAGTVRSAAETRTAMR